MHCKSKETIDFVEAGNAFSNEKVQQDLGVAGRSKLNARLLEFVSIRLKIEKQLNGLCLKLLPFHFTGLPDRLCLLPKGRVFFVETKSAGKELRPRQLYVKKQLESLGFKVYKIDSKENINELILEYK